MERLRFFIFVFFLFIDRLLVIIIFVRNCRGFFRHSERTAAGRNGFVFRRCFNSCFSRRLFLSRSQLRGIFRHSAVQVFILGVKSFHLFLNSGFFFRRFGKHGVNFQLGLFLVQSFLFFFQSRLFFGKRLNIRFSCVIFGNFRNSGNGRSFRNGFTVIFGIRSRRSNLIS